jgi:hypothetical protein
VTDRRCLTLATVVVLAAGLIVALLTTFARGTKASTITVSRLAIRSNRDTQPGGPAQAHQVSAPVVPRSRFPCSADLVAPLPAV